MRTPLSRAHGLGAAGEGAGHWWMQRITSVALVPLALWFGLTLAQLPDFSHAAMLAWVREPLTTVLLVAFLVAACYHMALGLQVIAEDYIHSAPLKVATIILIQLGSFLFALVGIAATAKIFFGVA